MSTKQVVDRRRKDFLTEAEMKRFLDAAREGHHGVRDHAMMLMAYRHGLRVSELVDLRLKDLDLETGRLFVKAQASRTDRVYVQMFARDQLPAARRPARAAPFQLRSVDETIGFHHPPQSAGNPRGPL